LILGGTPKAKAALWTGPDADCAKARGANRIRYPGSPGRKRWTLVPGGPGSPLGYSAEAECWVVGLPFQDAARAQSVPPEEYGRKAENQGNWRVPAQAAEHVA